MTDFEREVIERLARIEVASESLPRRVKSLETWRARVTGVIVAIIVMASTVGGWFGLR